MKFRLLVPIVAALAVALVVAGCGSSDDTSSNEASLTKAEFVKEGNAICDAGNKEINAGFEETFTKGQQPSKAEFSEAIESVLIPSVSKQIGEIKRPGRAGR